MTREERLAAARQRLFSRYPDRDEQEAKHLESFKGLTKEQLKERFKRAAEDRGVRVAEEKRQRDEAISC